MVASPPPPPLAGHLVACPTIAATSRPASFDHTQDIVLAFDPWTAGLHVHLNFPASHAGVVPARRQWPWSDESRSKKHNLRLS